ncbi:hypothetical protein ACWFMI_13355 [Nocardiopsis terrae]
MGEASTVAGNTADGAAGGRSSERAHELLAGISKAFETAMDGLDRESVEKRINSAFAAYYADHRGPVEKVEQNGVTISRNVVSAAERVNQADGEAEEGHRSAVPYVLNPIFTDQAQTLPVGVLAPEYYGSGGPTHLQRDVNR